jgi:hypothetical protein
MKVLVLGTGKKDNIFESKCHPCLTKDEYIYCVKQAKTEGQLVTVDINPSLEPDIICCVHQETWIKTIKGKYGNNFDIIIDTIGDFNPKTNYAVDAKQLMKEDGIFYGYKNGQKYIWFNTNTPNLGSSIIG